MRQCRQEGVPNKKIKPQLGWTRGDFGDSMQLLARIEKIKRELTREARSKALAASEQWDE